MNSAWTLPGIILGVMILFCVLAAFANKHSNNSRRKEYLEMMPDAVRVYLRAGDSSESSRDVYLDKVNGASPITFRDANGTGFYVQPGENVILLSKGDAKKAMRGKAVLLPEETLVADAGVTYTFRLVEGRAVFDVLGEPQANVPDGDNDDNQKA